MSEDFIPDKNEFRCLVPFPDGSDSFVHGFEAGMIWQRMVAGEANIGGMDEVATHSANRRVFERMAAAQGYDITVEADDGEWMIATFTKRRTRFRLVESAGGGERG